MSWSDAGVVQLTTHLVDTVAYPSGVPVRDRHMSRSVRIDDAVGDHLEWLATHGYAASTLRARSYHLRAFVTFCQATGAVALCELSPRLLEDFQRHLHRHRTRQGAPLSFRTQCQRLVPVKVFCSWAADHGLIDCDPAAALVLPKTERRLPEAVLSAEEVEAVLRVPDLSTPLGLRDRAILETLYSTAIRRNELIGLRTADVDLSRGLVFVRRGKGGADRYVPIGRRAGAFVARYRDTVRPHFIGAPEPDALFLTAQGRPLAPDVLSRAVAAYVRAALPGRRGSCHLFRHAAATLMLENGADVRHVAEMLGHAKLETTMVYTRVSMTKLRAVHAACHPAEHDGVDPLL